VKRGFAFSILSEIQDLSNIVPQLLMKIMAKADVPIKLRVQIALGDRKKALSDDVAEQVIGCLKPPFWG